MHERSVNRERHDAIQRIRAKSPKPTNEFVALQATKPRLNVWKAEGEVEEKRRLRAT